MPLWLVRPQPLRARLRQRRARQACWRRPASASRSARRIDERAVEARSAGAGRCRPPRRASGARQGASRWRRRCPAGWCSAPTRRWRAASSASASRPTAPLRASSCAHLRGRTPRAAFGAGAGARRHGLFDMRRYRALDHARFLRPLPRGLSRHGAATGGAASVGGYQLEGIGIHLFERVEGDYFTILGLPLLPLLGFLRREGSGRLGHDKTAVG